LKLKCGVLLSTFAFKFNLRRYSEVIERPFNWQEPNHDLTGVVGRSTFTASKHGFLKAKRLRVCFQLLKA
jgi:hypothetical protein